MIKKTASALILRGGAAPAARAEEVPPDKDSYALFDPAPFPYPREISLAQPDKTDSPFTVDAGHFQLEMDYVSFTDNVPTAAHDWHPWIGRTRRYSPAI